VKLTTDKVYNCEPADYWNMYFDEEKRRVLETEGGGVIGYKVLEKTEQGGKVMQRVELIERNDAPKPIRKLFGETTKLFEETNWQEGSETATVNFRPEKMADRVKMTGAIRVSSAGEGKCRVVIDWDLTVKIFGVGGMLEKMMAKEIPARAEKLVKYFNERMAQ